MRRFALALCIIFCLSLTAGCTDRDGAENIVFTAVVEGVGEYSVLVTTSDDVGFDKASVKYSDGLDIDFNLVAGQTVKITIKPEIAESYPVQVQAVAIELVSQPEPDQ